MPSKRYIGQRRRNTAWSDGGVMFQGCVNLRQHDPSQPVPDGWLLLEPFDDSLPGAAASIEAFRRAEVRALGEWLMAQK
jgi:hypothetical protein